MSGTFKLALVQLAVGANKSQNLLNAASKVREAVAAGAKLVSLPECFNSPYGTQHFPEYAEPVPSGESCQALQSMAKGTGSFIPSVNSFGISIFLIHGAILKSFDVVRAHMVRIYIMP